MRWPATCEPSNLGNMYHNCSGCADYRVDCRGRRDQRDAAQAVSGQDGGNVTVVIDFSEFGTVVATIEVPPGEILDLSTG